MQLIVHQWAVGPAALRVAMPVGGLSASLEASWRPFASDGPGDMEVRVAFDRRLPARVIPARPRVRRAGPALRLDGENLALDADLTHRAGTLTIPEALYPFETAMRYLVAALLGDRGLLVHASCVAGPAGAVAAFGASGAGKSTVAREAAARASILAEEIALLAEDGAGRTEAWGVPFAGGRPGRHALLALWALRRGPGAVLEPLDEATAVRELMANAVLAGDGAADVDRLFRAVTRLVQSVELRTLVFAPGCGAGRLVADRVAGLFAAERAA